MLCFNDRTYCASPNCQNECGRKMTDDEKDKAMTSAFPVSWGFFCGEPPPLELEALIKNQSLY